MDNGIGWAVKQLQIGDRVTRRGWNGRAMWLWLQPAREIDTPAVSGCLTTQPRIAVEAHVMMKTAQGYHIPWLCSQADLLATDWVFAS